MIITFRSTIFQFLQNEIYFYFWVSQTTVACVKIILALNLLILLDFESNQQFPCLSVKIINVLWNTVLKNTAPSRFFPNNLTLYYTAIQIGKNNIYLNFLEYKSVVNKRCLLCLHRLMQIEEILERTREQISASP